MQELPHESSQLRFSEPDAKLQSGSTGLNQPSDQKPSGSTLRRPKNLKPPQEAT